MTFRKLGTLLMALLGISLAWVAWARGTMNAAGSRTVTATTPRDCPLTGTVTCSDVVYMVMVDRFSNGNPANDLDVDRRDPRAFHGGDLAGVRAHLQELKALGISVLWLSPLYPNPRGGYHGYWPLDFRSVDPRFGSLGELRQLVEEAHSRDVKIILDMVFNHTAPQHPWRSDPTRRSWYHNRGPITNWSDPQEVLQGDLLGLPDLNQENPAVTAYLLDTARWWLDQTGADGFRLDAARHVPIAFWRQLASTVRGVRPGAFLLAEVFDTTPGAVRPYLEAGLDAAFDFGLQAAITETFARAGGLVPLRSALYRRSLAVDDPRRLAVFVDNHDLPRFLYQAGFDHQPEQAVARLRAALAFIMTVPGIPVLYYGTETGMTGGPDPYNRADMRFDDPFGLRPWTAAWIELRRQEPALQSRTLELQPVPGSPRLLVYLRFPGGPNNPMQGEGSPILVAIQADDRPAGATTVALTGLPPGFTGRARLLSGQRDEPASATCIPIHADPATGRAVMSLPPLAAWDARAYRIEPLRCWNSPFPALLSVTGGGAMAALISILLWARSRCRRRHGFPPSTAIVPAPTGVAMHSNEEPPASGRDPRP